MSKEPAIRGLVVDDDPESVALLMTLLRRRGIDAESADAGDDAATLLRANEYDLAFIDLGSATKSGEHLMREIEAGSLKRPVSLALISPAADLAGASHGSWARNVTLLSKPFAFADVSVFIDRAFLGAEREAVPRPILLGGDGAWCEAAALVATHRGARCIIASSAERILALCEEDHPLAVVLGPPGDPLDIMWIAAQVKAGQGGAGIAVFVAMMDEDAGRTADLLTIGVDRIVSIAAGVHLLSEELLRVANVTRRVSRRVPLFVRVLVHAEQAIHVGHAFDIGEGGIGLDMTGELPRMRAVIAEFTLPGDRAPISAHSEIAWVLEQGGGRHRIGLHFKDVVGAERVKSYVALA